MKNRSATSSDEAQVTLENGGFPASHELMQQPLAELVVYLFLGVLRVLAQISEERQRGRRGSLEDLDRLQGPLRRRLPQLFEYMLGEPSGTLR